MCKTSGMVYSQELIYKTSDTVYPQEANIQNIWASVFSGTNVQIIGPDVFARSSCTKHLAQCFFRK